MIRLFLNLCKCLQQIKGVSEIEILDFMQKHIYSELKHCPICHAPAEAFHKDGSYERDFISYENGTVTGYRITIRCVECSSCGHSHALEPSVIVPYSSYSIGFLLHLMYTKLTGIFSTVESLCSHFDISISTYYRIYKCFLEDSFLMKQITDAIGILSFEEVSRKIFHYALSEYFKSTGRSFLQPYVRLRPKVLLKNLSRISADTLTMVLTTDNCYAESGGDDWGSENKNRNSKHTIDLDPACV